MINVVANKQGYSVSFIQRVRTFGPNVHRMCVECDIYVKEGREGSLEWVNKGIAICNPVDTFNPKIGAHKALTSATASWMNREDRKELHAQVDGWAL